MLSLAKCVCELGKWLSQQCACHTIVSTWVQIPSIHAKAGKKHMFVSLALCGKQRKEDPQGSLASIPKSSQLTLGSVRNREVEGD